MDENPLDDKGHPLPLDPLLKQRMTDLFGMLSGEFTLMEMLGESMAFFVTGSPEDRRILILGRGSFAITMEQLMKDIVNSVKPVAYYGPPCPAEQPPRPPDESKRETES